MLFICAMVIKTIARKPSRCEFAASVNLRKAHNRTRVVNLQDSYTRQGRKHTSILQLNNLKVIFDA